jgi:hypothetical protein
MNLMAACVRPASVRAGRAGAAAALFAEVDGVVANPGPG